MKKHIKSQYGVTNGLTSSSPRVDLLAPQKEIVQSKALILHPDRTILRERSATERSGGQTGIAESNDSNTLPLIPDTKATKTSEVQPETSTKSDIDMVQSVPAKTKKRKKKQPILSPTMPNIPEDEAPPTKDNIPSQSQIAELVDLHPANQQESKSTTLLDKPKKGTAVTEAESSITPEEPLAKAERRAARKAARKAAKAAGSRPITPPPVQPTIITENIVVTASEKLGLTKTISEASHISSISDFMPRKPWYKRIKFFSSRSAESKDTYSKYADSSEVVVIEESENDDVRSTRDLYGAENSSSSPGALTKREVVWDLLKKMARRDYMTEDVLRIIGC
jgi:hypothetical protein